MLEDNTKKQSISRDITLRNQRGLHARASAKFCTVVSAYLAKVIVTKDGHSANGCSIMGLLTLGAGMGSSIKIEIEGEEAEKIMQLLVELIENRFGEDE